MLAWQGHTCAGRSVLPEPVCERLSQPSGFSSCSPDISRARALQCAGLCGSEGHTQMADRSRKWGAVLDGAPEVAEVMPIARQAVRIRLQPQTVRDDENAYPAFDNRYRYAPEGADDALRTGTRSRAIYILRVLRACRAHARWSVRFCTDSCGNFAATHGFRMAAVRVKWTGPDDPANPEHGEVAHHANRGQNEPFGSEDAQPFAGGWRVLAASAGNMAGNCRTPLLPRRVKAHRSWSGRGATGVDYRWMRNEQGSSAPWPTPARGVAHPLTVASWHGIHVPDSPATRRRSIRSRSADRSSGFSYFGRLYAAR